MLLSMGISGTEVRELQAALNSLAQSDHAEFLTIYPPLAVDGIFGAKTKSRVVEFQTRNQLVGDGLVGPLTLGLIRLALEKLKKVMPPPLPPPGPYVRMHALIYAATFHNRICSDGKMVTKTGFPREINGKKVVPGALLSDYGDIWGIGEEDCTHFISHCIGQPPRLKFNGIEVRGGGLRLNYHPKFKEWGIYGHTYVPRLIDDLVNRKLATVIAEHMDKIKDPESVRKLLLTKMQPGDLIAYSNDPKRERYLHFGILVGPDSIACHSISRWGADFTIVAMPYVTLLKLP